MCVVRHHNQKQHDVMSPKHARGDAGWLYCLYTPQSSYKVLLHRSLVASVFPSPQLSLARVKPSLTAMLIGDTFKNLFRISSGDEETLFTPDDVYSGAVVALCVS